MLYGIQRRAAGAVLSVFCLWLGSLLAGGDARAATVTHTGNISGNTIWSADDVHLVTGNVTVIGGVTLTIEAGTVVKFNPNTRLTVQGALDATGTAGNEIHFTSYRDDSVGGDTNGDGASAGQRDDWDRIEFQSTVNTTFTNFEHVVVRYGGSGNIANVYINRTNVTVASSEIRESGWYGIYVNNASPTISDSVISDNTFEGIFMTSAGSAQILGNTIERNRNGIYANSSSTTPTIADNTIQNNDNYGVYFVSTPSAPRLSGNTITDNLRPARLPVSALPDPSDGNVLVPNGINVLELRGNTQSGDLQVSVLAPAAGPERLLAYHLVSGTWVVGNAATLTVDPGVVLKGGSSTQLRVDGTLNAVGTAEDPVVFTSLSDDAHGGDSNLDGTSSAPGNGNWRGLYFNAAEASTLSHAKVLYGGQSGWANLYVVSTPSLSVSDAVVANSGNLGFYIQSATVGVTDSEIVANSVDGIHVTSSGVANVSGGRIFANQSDGVEVISSGGLSLTGAEVFANVGAGVRLTGTQAIDVSGNWWGDPSGPGGDEAGAGDQVIDTGTGSITVTDFVTDGTEFSYLNAGPNTAEGTIAAPTVVQGTDTTEFGTSPQTRALFDLDRVIVNYASPSLPAAGRYELLVTYINADNTAAAGGNVQRLTAGPADAFEIHGAVGVTGAAVTRRYLLPPEAHSADSLELNVVKLNGFRATASQVWVIERGVTGDETAPVSSLDAPAAAAQLAASPTQIEGSSADEALGSGLATVEVGIDGGGGIVWRTVTELRPDGSWSYRWGLPADGPQTLFVRATDRAGNVEVPGAGRIVEVNRTAPAPATGIYAFDTPADTGGSTTVRWTLSVDDGAGADDVASYRMERREAGTLTFSTLGSVGAGTAELIDGGATLGTDFDYRAVAVDLAGNETASAVYGPIASLNNTGDVTAPDEVTALTATPGDGFAFVSWTGSADSAGDLVDQLFDISVDGGPFGGEVTLNKITATRLVTGLTNGVEHTFRVRTRDGALPTPNVSTGATVAATPDPTAVTPVSGTISTDTEWAAGVFHVTNTVTVADGSTLTIQPGVVVKFDSSRYLQVNGGLRAVGTVAEPIVFTAFADDDFGGDSNGNGDATSPSPGSWGQIRFANSTDEGVTRLEQVIVRYGGQSNIGNIYMDQANVPLVSSQVEHSSTYGIYLTNASPTISDSTISDNGWEGIFLTSASTAQITANTVERNRNGIYANSSTTTPTIADNTIQDNANYGVYFNSTSNAPELTGNTIVGNAKPARIPFSALPDIGSGNLLTGNTFDRLELRGNTLTRSVELDTSLVYYQVTGTAIVGTGVQLRLQPGVVWKFSSSILQVSGALTAVGTAGNEITFTSYRDDSVGGDTNGDGPSAGQRNDWNRIEFTSTVLTFLTSLEHVVVRYGGSGNIANVYINRTNVTVASSEIRESGWYGIYVNNASPTISDSVISDNTFEGIFLTSTGSAQILGNTIERNRNGIYANSGSTTPTIADNTIRLNTDRGVFFAQTSGAPRLSGNTITDNLRPARLPVSALPDPSDGNVLVPNGINVLELRGNTQSGDLQVSVLAPAAGPERLLAYHLVSGTWVVGNTATLTVDPGVVLKFTSSRELRVDGTLSAVGTASDPVVFTSLSDDAHGGDSNLDGASTAPGNGNWRGINFNSADASTLSHVKVLYGGQSSRANLYVVSTPSLTVSDAVVANSGHLGIYVQSSIVGVTDSEIVANSNDGIHVTSSGVANVSGGRLFANQSDGVEVVSSGDLSLTGAEVFANVGAGVRSSSNQALVATGNWWGDPSGPGGDEAGSGDQVIDTGSGSIDAIGGGTDFLTDGTEFAYFDAGGSASESYIIGLPAATGTASTEWGSSAPFSFLYNLEGTELSAQYAGLVPTASYRLYATYLNQDSGGGVQTLRDGNGDVIHNAFPIPFLPVSHSFVMPKSSYDSGNLTLVFERTSGARTTLAALVILRDEDLNATDPVVALIAPEDGAILPGGIQAITGTAVNDDPEPIAVEVGIEPSGGAISWRTVTSFTPDGIWSYRWSNPANGGYGLRARATDSFGNRSETAAINVTVDTVPPAAATNLVADSVGGGIRVLWTLSDDDGAGAGDVVRYDILRSQEQFGEFTAVGSVAAGVASFDDTTVTLGEDYFYQVLTVDLAGRSTASATVGPVTPTTVVDSTPPEDVTGLAAAVTNDGAVGGILLSWTGSANSAGDLVDQRLYISNDGGATFGSNAPDYDDGQAIALGLAARNHFLENLTIGQSYTLRLTVVDEVPNESGGAEVVAAINGGASEFITLGGSLAASTTLGKGVYRITSILTVASGQLLTLQPGSILKFNSSRYLQVNGGLRAVGTVAEPIVFTAFADDDFGGDSNGNGDATSPSPGSWGQIRFANSTDEGVSRLEQVIVRYGGQSSIGNIYMDQANVPLVSSQVEHSSTYGIYLTNASPTISDSTISDNAWEGIFLTSASTALITANTVERNRNGIYANSSTTTPTIADNTIQDNADYGVYFVSTPSAPTLTGNTIVGNLRAFLVPARAFPDGTNVVTPNTQKWLGIRGNNIGSSKRLRIWDPGTVDEVRTYRVFNGDIFVPSLATLTIDPGAILKFEGTGTGIEVEGALVADATLDNKIVLTSYRDDRFGGDTNGDGVSTLPANGNWRGVWFDRPPFPGQSSLNHVQILYAGANGSRPGGLYLDRANISVKNCEVANSSVYGIYVDNASPDVIGCRIWGNSSDGVRITGSGSNPSITFSRISTNLSDGMELVSSARATATNNQIFQNRGFGIKNGTTNVVDATQTWWGDGDASGPLHATTNPGGTGDQVSDNVTYAPFVTDIQTPYSYNNYSVSAASTAGTLSLPALGQGTLSDEWDSSSLRPDRTMAWDQNAVILNYTGIDSSRRYKIRVSYYNGDTSNTFQSLTDGFDTPIHGSVIMPRTPAPPVQYEFSIAPALYADGNLTLKFVNDNSATEFRAALPEIWLIEDIEEISPPLFEAIAYNDVDGSQTLTIGDEYYFSFSEPMDTSLIADGTTDANTRLDAGGAIYGTLNESRWSADELTVIVTLTAGFDVTGSETVTPVGLTDQFSNAAIGAQLLTTVDTVAPRFVGLLWDDVDTSGSVSEGDTYSFQFDEAMNQSAILDGTTGANAQLRPETGAIYGTVNTVAWSPDGGEVTVTVTSGFSVIGDELVIPSAFVTDVAGNAAVGTQNLLGKDTVPPLLVGLSFDDADGNGAVSIGDRYFFDFDEPIRPSALSTGTTEANLNLPPDGKKYGTINDITLSADFMRATVKITAGVTIDGSETVDPSDEVTDRAGNPVANTIALTLVDSVAPQVSKVQPNFISPLNETDNYRLTVQFDSSMDPAIQPTLTLTSTALTDPVVPGGGTFLTTVYNNDTYTTPDIALASGMDGTLSLSVAGARDWNGNEMAPASDVFTATLDATPPNNPTVAVASVSCESATLDWSAYSAPGDLAGFQVYNSTGGSFTEVDGTSFTSVLAAAARNVTIGSLDFEVGYDLAVAAFDSVGNVNPSVVSHNVFIDQTLPPPVAASVGGGADPDSALVDWSGFNTSNLCGLAGFRVYMELADFTTVSALTPVATLDAAATSHTIGSLDRGLVYYIAVVGFNLNGEFTDAVTAQVWTDPLAGEIASDTTIGGGEETEISITETMIVRNNATLTIEPGTKLLFDPGTGIIVESGALVAQGDPFNPIVLTSANDNGTDAPGPGDWLGVLLASFDAGSSLDHVVIQYGQGLKLSGSAPTVANYSAFQNDPAGLSLSDGASLTTSAALLRFNAVGAQSLTSSALTLGDSVIKTNTINASVEAGATFGAQQNWWGALDLVSIQSTVSGAVDVTNFLTGEPVLSPAVRVAGEEAVVVTRDISLEYASRNAEEVRTSEDQTFSGVFYTGFAPSLPFTLSDVGELKTVYAQFRSVTNTESSPVSTQVEYVDQGPVVTAFSLTDGQTVNRPIQVDATVDAILGVDSLEFQVDGVSVETVNGTSLSFLWDVRELTDDSHVISLVATDLGGNVETLTLSVIVARQPPAAPNMTSPLAGVFTVPTLVTVAGTAEADVDVQIRRNAFVVDTVRSDLAGAFSLSGVSLNEGDNSFTALAIDALGQSSTSNTIVVTLDTAPPNPPELADVSASPSQGGILINWFEPVLGERPTGYEVYRSTEDFTDPGQATLVVARDVDPERPELAYGDFGLADGTYFYGVVGLDSAGNPSGLSNVMFATLDSTPPSFTVAYAVGQPAGVGMLDVTLVSDEPTVDEPTLTIRPQGASSPTVIPMTLDGAAAEVTHTGQYDVTQFAPTGPVAVTVSGTDFDGNAFSGAPAGVQLVFDTDGPVGTFATDLPAPIQVTSTITITVTLDLDEPQKTGVAPVVSFIPPTGSPVTVPMIGSETSWSGILVLEPTMGRGIGSFTLSAFDALDNQGTQIADGGQLEIYDSATPDPTLPPSTLSAPPQPAGEVQLEWSLVAEADSYSVLRRTGDCSSDPTDLVAGVLTGTTFLDLPSSDGTYCYGVRTDRLGAVSDLSPLAETFSDRTPPAAPDSVAVSLASSGIVVSWDGPSTGEVPTSYLVYRDGALVRTLGGGLGSFSITDFPPVGGSFEYVVASRDLVGNETPSGAVQFDLLVGAVSNLQAEVVDDQTPTLSWLSNDPDVVGYNVYKGDVKLNALPIGSPNFTDDFFAGASRADYAVTAVNGADDESPPRNIEVFPLDIALAANPDDDGNPRPLITDYFSLINVSVTNGAAVASFDLQEVDLSLTVDATEQFSASQAPATALAPGAAFATDFTVPIGGQLADHLFEAAVVQTNQVGATTTYRRTLVVDGATDITPSVLQVTLALDDVPLAGGFTAVNICVLNQGYTDLDVVTARSNGSEPGDISVAIENADGLVISSAEFQGSPTGAILYQGTTFLRVAPGNQGCVDVDILVPVNLEAGDVISFIGRVAGINSDLVSSGVAGFGQLSGRLDSGITLSPYFGTAQADRDFYGNEETAIITGQAIDRESGLPVANAPLKVGLFIRGYKWFTDVQTDANGDYSFAYNPTIGLAGEFTTWGAHPDVFDIINQDRFGYFRMYALPSEGTIRSAKTDTLAFKIKLHNPTGSPPLTGFSMTFRGFTVDGEGTEIDEPKLQGTANFPGGYTIEAGKSKEVELTITADADAPDTANAEYRFETAEGAVATFTAVVELLPAIATIIVESPGGGFVEESVDRGQIVVAPVVVKNNGLRVLTGAELIPPTNPSWIGTNLPLDANGRVPLGDIEVGETRAFDVVLAPPLDQPFGFVDDGSGQLPEFKIVGADTEQEFPVQVLVLVTSDLVGDVQFSVMNTIGQPVENATVRMKKPEIFEEITPVKTDFNGDVTVLGLQEGAWSYQIVAAGHSTMAGTVVVKADQAVLVDALLDRNLVTISFTVEPVPFTDRYTIKIEQTFVTNVPVPVLTVFPAYTHFDNVEPGFQTTVIAEVSNKGLIDIRELKLFDKVTVAGSLQPLITFMPRLRAQETVQVPYVVTYFGPNGQVAGFADGCADNNPISSMGEFFAGLNALLLGFAPTQVTGAERAIMSGIAMGLAAAGAAGVAGFLGSIVGWIGYCLFGGLFGDGGDGGIGPGASSPAVTSGYGPGGVGCFLPGTPIRMADGTQRPIEQIAKGDRVLTFEGSGARVTEVYKKASDHIRELRYRILDGNFSPHLSVSLPAGGEMRRLQTTDEHLFWVTNKDRWAFAGEIEVGDRLVITEGRVGEIVETARFEGETVVHNFDVEKYFSYFANDVLVRQKCGGEPEIGVEDWIRRLIDGAETAGDGELPEAGAMTPLQTGQAAFGAWSQAAGQTLRDTTVE